MKKNEFARIGICKFIENLECEIYHTNFDPFDTKDINHKNWQAFIIFCCMEFSQGLRILHMKLLDFYKFLLQKSWSA